MHERPVGQFAFPRACRLLRSAEYASVRQRGERISTRFFIMYVAKSDAQTSRLGLIVSRKVGASVRRNRAKRVLREVFRLHRGGLGPAVDIVSIVKRSSDRPAYGAYEKDFLEGMGLYRRRRGVGGGGR
jgi:ribonuclease P protein component